MPPQSAKGPRKHDMAFPLREMCQQLIPPSLSGGVVLKAGGLDPLGRLFIYVVVQNFVKSVLSVVRCALQILPKHSCQSVDQHILYMIAFQLSDLR